jgi:hypothetical protein
VQLTARRPKIMVSADGTGILSQAGGLLLTQALRVTVLDRGLDAALERWRPVRAVHSPGKIITDVAVAVALGGDCDIPRWVAAGGPAGTCMGGASFGRTSGALQRPGDAA